MRWRPSVTTMIVTACMVALLLGPLTSYASARSKPTDWNRYYAGQKVWGNATEVQGKWAQPSFNAYCTKSNYSGALFGVELSLDLSDYVAVGTNLTCDHGKIESSAYSVFGNVYETGHDILPVTRLGSMAIHARDVIFGQILETGCYKDAAGTAFTNYTVVVQDISTNQSASTTFQFTNELYCLFTGSAFWGLTGTVWDDSFNQPLAKFSGLAFWDCKVTIGGKTGNLYSFGTPTTEVLQGRLSDQRLTITTGSGFSPSRFSVIWRAWY